MCQNMQAYQIIANSTCPNIDAELLPVSRLDYTMKIFLWPQVIVVKTGDAISIKFGNVSWNDH
jgi:hypothetical protein